jgi:hypothetical protein
MATECALVIDAPKFAVTPEATAACLSEGGGGRIPLRYAWEVKMPKHVAWRFAGFLMHSGSISSVFDDEVDKQVRYSR